MDIKDICTELGIKVTDFYTHMNTDVKSLSYHKKNNPQKYKDMITTGIVNFYKIEHDELLKILDLYNLQNTKAALHKEV